MVVWQAYRFALDPNDRQRGRLASHAGGARYAYNLGLQWLRASEGTQARALEMLARWDRWKTDPANGVSWWSDNARCVYQEAFIDLERAARDFRAGRGGKRFPRFKRKGKSRDHFRLRGLIGVGPAWIQLPT